MEGKPMRILVADDEKTLSFFLQKSLEEDPQFSVEVSHCGAEALVKMIRTPFDLVIVDLRMPDMDGLQLLRYAKDLNSSTRAILMTAYGSDGAEAAAKEMGVAYISKPFAIEDMKRLVSKSMKERRAKCS